MYDLSFSNFSPKSVKKNLDILIMGTLFNESISAWSDFEYNWSSDLTVTGFRSLVQLNQLSVSEISFCIIFSRPLVNEANPCVDLKLKHSSRDLLKIALFEQRPLCGSLCNRTCQCSPALCYCPQYEILLEQQKYTICSAPHTDTQWRILWTLSVYCSAY